MGTVVTPGQFKQIAAHYMAQQQRAALGNKADFDGAKDLLKRLGCNMVRRRGLRRVAANVSLLENPEEPGPAMCTDEGFTHYQK